MKKGQGATELLIVLGVGFIILLTYITLNYEVLGNAQRTVRYEKAQILLEDLASMGTTVYRQGPGARAKVRVEIPDEVSSLIAINNTLSLTFTSDVVYRNVAYNVTGDLPTRKGSYLITVQSFDEHVGFFLTDLYDPSSVTNLQSPDKGTTWIYLTWDAPSDSDFDRVIISQNGQTLLETSATEYNITGLTSNTTYTFTLHSVDFTGNRNGTDVSISPSTIVPTEFIEVSTVIRPKLCWAQNNANDSGTFANSCDGYYDVECGFNADLVTCNDGYQETQNAQRINNTYYWGGIKLTGYNTSVLTCHNISSVDICYEWFRDASLDNCDISVDADGDANYTAASSTCPPTSPEGVICTDVTALESWSCSSFFGTSGTRAFVKSEAERSGGPGTTIISWDALYFNVTYNDI